MHIFVVSSVGLKELLVILLQQDEFSGLQICIKTKYEKFEALSLLKIGVFWDVVSYQ
jgi:hypothetical protein